MKESEHRQLMFRFFTEIGIIEQLARAKLERALPDDLKISQFVVLNHLVRLPGNWPPAKLAEAFQVTKAAMTNTVHRLESRDLVKITAHPNDGRSKIVNLTDTGRNMQKTCIANIAPLLNEMEQALGQQNFHTTLPFLQEVRTYLDEHR